MKTSVKLIMGAGLLILLVGIAGLCLHHHYSQSGMRGIRQGMQRGEMYGMRQGMQRGEMYGMRRGMRPGMMDRMGRGMGPMAMNHMGHGNMGTGRFVDMIANITEKQKKDIGELRKTQQDEMIKLNEDMANKMKDLRKANREKILNLLTPEQKKFFESHTGIREPASPEQK